MGQAGTPTRGCAAGCPEAQQAVVRVPCSLHTPTSQRSDSRTVTTSKLEMKRIPRDCAPVTRHPSPCTHRDAEHGTPQQSNMLARSPALSPGRSRAATALVSAQHCAPSSSEQLSSPICAPAHSLGCKRCPRGSRRDRARRQEAGSRSRAAAARACPPAAAATPPARQWLLLPVLLLLPHGFCLTPPSWLRGRCRHRLRRTLLRRPQRGCRGRSACGRQRGRRRSLLLRRPLRGWRRRHLRQALRVPEDGYFIIVQCR